MDFVRTHEGITDWVRWRLEKKKYCIQLWHGTHTIRDIDEDNFIFFDDAHEMLKELKNNKLIKIRGFMDMDCFRESMDVGGCADWSRNVK